jgi:cytosine/adenosine deaminase-related metal-dependent hydrolase
VSDLVVCDVRPWAREPSAPSVDVFVRSGRIERISTHTGGGSDAGAVDRERVDGHGGVLVPAFADAHAHSTPPDSVCRSARTRLDRASSG